MEIRKEIARITDWQGVNAAIEFSGAASLFQASIECLKNRGRFSIGALYEKEFPFNPDSLLFKFASVTTVPGATGAMRKVIDMMSEGRLSGLRELITERCSLEEVPERLSGLKTNNAERIKVMVDVERESV
jgi:threonine dehydrogenase-like Zn-dependent dehydrogenase